MSENPVVEVRELVKTFTLGLVRARPRLPGEAPSWLERTAAKLPGGMHLHRVVEAVRGISFEVHRGEIFGFLGPNGAGKTTTLKTLLGFLFPTRGEVRLFGRPVTDASVRGRLGFLPENPYLYQYLTAGEIMDLCGRLAGLGEPERSRRARDLLQRVGLGAAVDRPVRKFSKGMLQRVGLAQALLGDPELLILDEPMTGLDPIGRKEVRDLILEERRRGRTVMFSSHILSDVEMLCDRVAIVRKGELAAYGSLQSLLRPEVRAVEIEIAGGSSELTRDLASFDATLAPYDTRLVVTLRGEQDVNAVLTAAMARGGRIVSVTPHRETLEDLFVREAIGASGARPSRPDAP